MKIKSVQPLKNGLRPQNMSACINLNPFPDGISASRQYMLGNNVGKSVRISHPTVPRTTAGFESEYGTYTRKIVAPSNMVVEKVFYLGSRGNTGRLTDDWTTIHVVFFNEELQMYDILHLPKFNTQNTYIGFEYVYDKEMMRRLRQENATFKKGEVFAHSPGLSDTGELMLGREAIVAGMTVDYTEEDGIGMTDHFLEQITAMFEQVREFAWNESEWVPLNLHGTYNDPRPFLENGEVVPEDGIVMGFRRRDGRNGITGLTRKALMRVDSTYDKLFHAPPGAVVKAISVTTERHKDRSHNKTAEKQVFPHTKVLDEYAQITNKMANDVKEWNRRLEAKYRGQRLPITNPLYNFIFKQLGEIIRDNNTGHYNRTKNTHRNKARLDWNVKITLKESVRGKKKFKLTSRHGAKGVVVKIIRREDAPRTADGLIADLVVNNTPSFRRQIFSALIEAAVNLVNLEIDRRMRIAVQEPQGYDKAYAMLSEFYHTVSPSFGALADQAFPTVEEQHDHVDYVLKNMISVQFRSDAELHGIKIVRAISEKYADIKPKQVTYVNELGQTITTFNPVIISSEYYMLLDKFGTDMASQSLPKRNLFGLPAKLNHNDKYCSWHRDQSGRNVGETESRLKESQIGGEEMNRQLQAATSPKIGRLIAQRLIRADDSFRIREIIRKDEWQNNRALHMAMNMVRDSGFNLRREVPDDIAS